MKHTEITRSGEAIEVWNVSGVVDFMAEQPEVKSLYDEAMLAKIKELLLGFGADGTRQFGLEDFLAYLDRELGEISGLNTADFLTGNLAVTRSAVDMALLEEGRMNGLSIYNASNAFWGDYFMTRSAATRSNMGLIDTTAGLWGTFFGGIGSLIAAGVVSGIAEYIEEHQGQGGLPAGDVPIWQCNPKWI